jgi:hypothetical protein
MKYILLLILLIYIKSYIPSYYRSCINPPKGGFTSVGTSECRKHNPSDGYCCLLYFYVKNKDHEKESRYEECIGITKKGYNNIKDLEVDVEEDMDLDSVYIDCNSKILKVFYISLFLSILNII